MTTPTWLIITLFILSFIQWYRTMGWLWNNVFEPVREHINDPNCHPPPTTHGGIQWLQPIEPIVYDAYDPRATDLPTFEEST